MFNPKLKLVVDDPFDGARVEGAVVPVAVRIKGATHDVTLNVAINGGTMFTLFTFPEVDHGAFEVGTDNGPVNLIFTALETHDAGDDDRFRSDVGRNLTMIPLGSPTADYPAAGATASTTRVVVHVVDTADEAFGGLDDVELWDLDQ